MLGCLTSRVKDFGTVFEIVFDRKKNAMNQIKISRALLLLVPLLAAAPLSQPTMSPAEIASGGNAFAIDLYHQLRKKKDGNIFFSPFSISTAFAMAYAGAEGKTEEQIAKVMRFDENTPDFHFAYGD
jgi:serpin B